MPETKNKNQTIAGLIAIVILIGVIIAIGLQRNANAAAYAKANDCTWHATGTAYGDDRDFICK